MKNHIQTAKTYIIAHKKQLIIGVAVIIAIAAIVAVITFFIANSKPKITYQPVAACDLLTTEEAQELLGGRAIRSSMKDPVISGDMAASSCGYTDGNRDTEAMKVAAIITRSGINDKGSEQNSTEFAAGRPTENVEIINNLGDSAYFNASLGQLNVLDGRRWVVISIGVGAAPQTNMIDDAVKLAAKVLN